MSKPLAAARLALTAVVAILATGGCALVGPSAAPTAPPAIAPILDSWRRAGLTCGDPNVGMPDEMPQWGCQGTMRGVRLNVVFGGDESGVMDMLAQVAPATNRETAIGVFDDLMAVTPAFSDSMPAIRAWIGSWDGSNGLVGTEIRGVRVSILLDATWITVSLSRRTFPAQPTPAPGES